MQTRASIYDAQLSAGQVVAVCTPGHSFSGKVTGCGARSMAMSGLALTAFPVSPPREHAF